MKSDHEVIFLGLAGLTHHYGGLSPDNVASSLNRGAHSSPRQAALQVLALARYLLSLGLNVAMLPPQLRPDLEALQVAGYTLENAPQNILEQVSSSSFMWAANAATVTSSSDSTDGVLYITVANLHTNAHRRIEADKTYHILQQIFANIPNVKIYAPLSAKDNLLDEGAANHIRLAPNHMAEGLNIFVYGKRQNLEASTNIAALHKVKKFLFIEQNPEVVEQGVFHNDVIAVGHENILLVHEKAYVGGLADIENIKTEYHCLHPNDALNIIVVRDNELSVAEAVGSYFFNSQIVTKPDGNIVVIAPQELQLLYGGKAAALMETYFDEVVYFDLKQSMRNGGGPACLRLRVVMDEKQIEAFSERLLTVNMLTEIEKLVVEFYPENLVSDSLGDVELYRKNKEFLGKLAKTMRLVL